MRIGIGMICAAIFLPQMALAELKVCNKTAVARTLAVAYGDGKGGWRSEGWWTLAPDACKNLQGGDLTQRNYYYTVQNAADFGGEGYSFCVQDGAFDLDKADGDCAGMKSAPFALIDTGVDAKSFVFDLTAAAFTAPMAAPKSEQGAKSEQAAAPKAAAETAEPLLDDDGPAPFDPAAIIAGPATVDSFVQGQQGEPFFVNATTQSCDTPEFSGCIFYGNGYRWAAERGRGSNEAALDAMAALPPATPINIQGDMIGQGDITAEVLISRIETGAGDQYQQTLQMLQGTWVSIDDPKSKLSIRGSEQTDVYDGEVMRTSMISFGDICGDSPEAGGYMILRALGGGDEPPMCYTIDSLTADQLNLFYVSASANTLVYTKEK